MEEATPGPICESALVPLYAVQDYGYNEAVAAFAEFDDEGELTMQFQGDKAKANLALYTFLVNHAPTILRLLDAVEGAEKALETVKAIETYTRWDGGLFYSNAGNVARSALAALRAAREVKP